MENKNIFENENVRLRLIDLEYDYKEKFASNIESEIKRAKTDFEVEVRRIYKEETHRDLPKIWKYTHLMNLLKKFENRYINKRVRI